jgi:hypothetical protein
MRARADSSRVFLSGSIPRIALCARDTSHPPRAPLVIFQESCNARATRKKSRIHAGLHDDSRLKHALVIARASCADRKRKIPRPALRTTSRWRAARRRTRANFDDASMMIAARDEDRARSHHVRDSLHAIRMRLSRERSRRTQDATASEPSDHRVAKIFPSGGNGPIDPESATRGEMGRFDLFRPRSRPSLPLMIVLRGCDAAMQHFSAMRRRPASSIGRAVTRMQE